MSILNALLKDLRDRKLWPLAVLLLVAIVATPLLLSGGKAAAPQAALPPLGVAVAQSHTGPTVSLDNAPVQVALTGHERDPFLQQEIKTAAKSSTSTVVTSSGSPASSGTASSTAGTGAGAGGSGASTVVTPVTVSSGGGSGAASSGSGSGAGSGASTQPSAGAAGLLPSQSYQVSLSISTPAGGVDTIDPLERLSPLPSAQAPLLVELGVLRGGDRVLFSVQPGTHVAGPGTCTPGPLDCEILSLAADQTETISGSSSPGQTLFAITGISVVDHGSAAAGAAARAAASTAGQAILATSDSNTLPLFPYDPQLGVVVDQRNLTVGGN